MDTQAMTEAIERARFTEAGLLPAIIQEAGTNAVLMLGWMDAEAMRRTFSGGLVTFWSRSRQEYWRKGDTSGNRLKLISAALDCDADTLLLRVEPVDAACHTGAHSCFDVDLIDAAGFNAIGLNAIGFNATPIGPTEPGTTP